MMGHRLWLHRPLFFVLQRQEKRLADVVRAMGLVADKEKSKNQIHIIKKVKQVDRRLPKELEKEMEFSIGL